MTNTENAVEIRGVTKSFGKTTAVDRLNLSIPKGSTLGLLGPNGAGKSTTLKMLVGMLCPGQGSIEVLHKDITQEPSAIKQRVGYVPETHQIYRWMSVKETLRFCKAMFQGWNDDLCGDLLDTFQLPADRRVRALSKGMLAKLSLLIALAHEPELLILDEPLSGLDPIARDEFLDGVMHGICRDDRTVLFSSHQLDEVSRLADSVAIMSDGKVMVHESIDSLLQNTRRLRAVLKDGRLPDAVPGSAIWQHIDRREWLLTVHPFDESVVDWVSGRNPVETVEVFDVNLDTVFKDFVRGSSKC